MASGLPDVDDLEDYGGALADYAPVEDPTTDESATYRNLYAMNVAGMTQTAPRAWCRFVGHATTPTDPASNVHGSVWGNTAFVKPTVAKGGTGIYTITWTSTQVDALDVTHTLALFTGWVNVESSTPYFVQVVMTAANVATVYVFNAAGAANDAAGVTFAVFVR